MNFTPYEHDLMFGVDKTDRIVAIETIPRRDTAVVIYRQDESGKVYEMHTNMTWVVYIRSDDPIIEQLDGMEYDDLLGNNFYNIRIHCKSKAQANWVKQNSLNSLMVLPSAQFFVQSGMTLFKEMQFDDILRAYCDIEVLTAEGYEFVNSSRPADKICIITIHFNHTYPDVVIALNEDGLTKPAENRVLCDSEKELLEKFVEIIRKTDPSVIIGHNFFKFDIPYIKERCMMYSVPFAIGRNGSEPYYHPTSIKFADKSEDYDNCVVYGRHILDTFFMAKQYDVIKRELPSYRLKDIVKYLKRASADRTYIEGDKLTWYWWNDREAILKYALEDVYETQIVEQSVGQTPFYSTQMFPLPYRDMVRYGSGTMIDNWLIRDYYNELWSLPTPDPKIEYGGAYTDTYMFGVIKGRLVYVDVASLYPTIRDIFHIKPPKDELNVYDTKMKLLKRVRIEYKKIAKQFEKNADIIKEYLTTIK